MAKKVTFSEAISASFRDPSGFIFQDQGQIYRVINQSYKSEFEFLVSSGLHKDLVDKNQIVDFIEVNDFSSTLENVFKVVKPAQIPFISYPYEWCFGQYVDAAILTLEIHLAALNHGMSLKDASAYNIQFIGSNPIFIDSLSFERYEEGSPWVAYRQFCQHFLAPLSLMSYKDVRLSDLMVNHIDGIPLDLASKILPFKSRFNFALFIHLHLHSGVQKRYESQGVKKKKASLSKGKQIALVNSLKNCIKGLKYPSRSTEWDNYYNITNYSDIATKHKLNLVEKYIDQVSPKLVWDLGANNGTYTKLAADKGIYSVAFDIDPNAVEANYQMCNAQSINSMLPLIMDLTNPSPGIGWAGNERSTLEGRSQNIDLIMALAIVHHLAISNNVPLDFIAKWLSKLGKYLAIEFVPKGDSQVDILLLSRKDIFVSYSENGFETAFSEYFNILEKDSIDESSRSIYLMKSKHNEP